MRARRAVPSFNSCRLPFSVALSICGATGRASRNQAARVARCLELARFPPPASMRQRAAKFELQAPYESCQSLCLRLLWSSPACAPTWKGLALQLGALCNMKADGLTMWATQPFCVT
ncbi:unnamed protein product [Symbiodinium natans]|uniref:Uncharacterized protein n=1 Tax=Symbiodinium natans TaxID=878477 RepID=A0A812JQ55_9DINO|nr:unnamed protein product [Symbiodinium natans]